MNLDKDCKCKLAQTRNKMNKKKKANWKERKMILK